MGNDTIIPGDVVSVMTLHQRAQRFHARYPFVGLGEFVSAAMEAEWRALRTHDPAKGPLASWVAVKAHYAMQDCVRARTWWKRTRRADAPAAPVYLGTGGDEDDMQLLDEAPLPDELLLLRQRRELVIRALERLPTIERELVEEHYFGARRFDEIAAERGLSKFTACRHHRRALRRLRAILTPEPTGDTSAG